MWTDEQATDWMAWAQADMWKKGYGGLVVLSRSVHEYALTGKRSPEILSPFEAGETWTHIEYGLLSLGIPLTTSGIYRSWLIARLGVQRTNT